MADVTNVKVGVCSVTYNSVDLGHTKGGVEVSYEPEYHDVSVDKYGNTVVEKYLIGEKFMATVPLAEYTIANLNKAMPQSTLAGGGNERVTLGATSGQKATTDAAELVLHPIAEAGRDFDIVIYQAYVASTITLQHSFDEERIIEVVFEAILDESKSDGNYLGLIGDSAT